MNTLHFYGLTKAAYSVNETIALLSISRTTLYLKMKTGELIATKCGKKTLFLATDIAAFLSGLQRNQPSDDKRTADEK